MMYSIKLYSHGQRLEDDWLAVLLSYLLIGSLRAMCYGVLTHSREKGKRAWLLLCQCFVKQRRVGAESTFVFVRLWVVAFCRVRQTSARPSMSSFAGKQVTLVRLHALSVSAPSLPFCLSCFYLSPSLLSRFQHLIISLFMGLSLSLHCLSVRPCLFCLTILIACCCHGYLQCGGMRTRWHWIGDDEMFK